MFNHPALIGVAILVLAVVIKVIREAIIKSRAEKIKTGDGKKDKQKGSILEWIVDKGKNGKVVFGLFLAGSVVYCVFPKVAMYLYKENWLLIAVLAASMFGLYIVTRSREWLNRILTAIFIFAIIAVLTVAFSGKADKIDFDPKNLHFDPKNLPDFTKIFTSTNQEKTEVHKPQWIYLSDGSITANLQPGQMITKTFYLMPGESSVRIKVPSGEGQEWNLRFNHDRDVFFQVEEQNPVLVEKDKLTRFPYTKGSYRCRFIGTGQMTEIQMSIVRLS